MQWVGSLPIVICFGSAAVPGIVAFYTPFVDNLPDAIETPLAIAAGTILAASFLPITEFTPWLIWILAIIARIAAAETVQAVTGLFRLFS